MKSYKYLLQALALFASAPVVAFQPGACGLYANSQLTTSIGFIEAQTAVLTTQMPSGGFSMFGVEFEHTLGWSHWISLDMFGGYGVSVGGESTGLITSPTKAETYDLGASLYTSIPCTRERRLFIEPMVGFFALKASTKDNLVILNDPNNAWVDLRFWGPMAGLFLRMNPIDRFMVRVGGAYLMPRLWEKTYPFTGESPVVSKLRGARAGSLASLSLSYEATSALSLYVKLDYQFYATDGGSTAQRQSYRPHLARSRFSWGTSFSY